jgi:hypothetical protein
VLRILDEKINMFELVVGEVGAILGEIEEQQEFSTLVLDGDRRKFGGAAANRLFSRLFSGRGWMRGLDVEAGKDRG